MADPYAAFSRPVQQSEDPYAAFSSPVSAAQPVAAEAPQRDVGDLGDAIREPLLSLATGSVAMPIAGLAGIGAGVTKALGLTQAEPGDVVNRVQGALTYQPRTVAGQTVGSAIAYPFEKLAQGADWAGEKVRQGTGSELLATGVNTAIQSAPALLAKVKGGRTRSPTVDRPVVAGETPTNKGVPATAKRQARLEGVSEAVAPSRAELIDAKNAAYKRADEAGIVVRESSLKGLKTRLVSATKKEGIDKDLHPDASAALSKIINTKGNLTLTELETLRRVASDASGSVKPADRRIASMIEDELDNYIDNLADADVLAGDAAKAKALKEARGLYARAKKSETIATLIDRAETKAGANYTQAGMEHALRAEFKSLALNEKQMRRFNEAERAAIKKIARGGTWENALRNLGKFDPTSGGMAAFMTSLLAGGGVTFTGGASLLLPAAAYAAKRKATKITSKKVEALDEMVRRGKPLPEQPAKATPRNAMLEY